MASTEANVQEAAEAIGTTTAMAAAMTAAPPQGGDGDDSVHIDIIPGGPWMGLGLVQCAVSPKTLVRDLLLRHARWSDTLPGPETAVVRHRGRSLKLDTTLEASGVTDRDALFVQYPRAGSIVVFVRLGSTADPGSSGERVLGIATMPEHMNAHLCTLISEATGVDADRVQIPLFVGREQDCTLSGAGVVHGAAVDAVLFPPQREATLLDFVVEAVPRDGTPNVSWWMNTLEVEFDPRVDVDALVRTTDGFDSVRLLEGLPGGGWQMVGVSVWRCSTQPRVAIRPVSDLTPGTTYQLQLAAGGTAAIFEERASGGGEGDGSSNGIETRTRTRVKGATLMFRTHSHVETWTFRMLRVDDEEEDTYKLIWFNAGRGALGRLRAAAAHALECPVSAIEHFRALHEERWVDIECDLGVEAARRTPLVAVDREGAPIFRSRVRSPRRATSGGGGSSSGGPTRGRKRRTQSQSSSPREGEGAVDSTVGGHRLRRRRVEKGRRGGKDD